MQKNKKFIKLFFGFSILFLFATILFNFVIDPYQQYRKPTLYKTFYGSEQRGFNPGLAKNHSYSSIVTGSSMTENFLISKVSEIMPDPIKLSISAATAHEIFLILNTAFASKNEVKNILVGLDIYSVSGDYKRLSSENSMPLYIYDYDYLNDIFYLANFDIVKRFAMIVSAQIFLKNDPRWEYEHMYVRQHLHENDFGKKNVLNMLSKDKKEYIKKDDNKKWNFDVLKNSFNHNFLQLIKSNPDKNFIFFYPPYSVIEYNNWKEKEILDDIELFKRYVIGEFAKLPNVSIYDFQSADFITTNLDNYRDFSHYHQKINSWMIDQIKVKNYLVTEQNIDAHLENIRNQIIRYELGEFN